MSTSIIEALMNAECNLGNANVVGMAVIPIAQEQLHNAVALLLKGYCIDEDVDELIEQYGSVEEAPRKEATNDRS